MENEHNKITPTTDSSGKTTRIVNGFILGAIASTLLIVILTIVGELYSPLKTLLKEQHHHHWVGKGVWAAGLFIIVGFGYTLLSRKTNSNTTPRLLNILSWTLIFSLAALFAFFIYEFFAHI